MPSSYIRISPEAVIRATDHIEKKVMRYRSVKDRNMKRRLLARTNWWRRLLLMRRLEWDEYDPGVV